MRRGRAVVASMASVVAVLGTIGMPAADSAAVRGERPARAACDGAWHVVATPSLLPGSGELFDVEAIGASDGWAVGVQNGTSAGRPTLAEHWDGMSWTPVPVPEPANTQGSALTAVSAVDADDVWAVGSKTMNGSNLDRTFTVHWDGMDWTIVPSPNAGTPRTGDLTGVVAIAADDAWAVGSTSGQTGPNRTLVLHWDGAAWSRVKSPNKGPWPNGLSDVDAVATDDVWAVGSWFTKAFVDRTLTLHWDGATWTRVPSPSPGKHEDRLAGVAAIGPATVIAVGLRGLRTLVERWNGSEWRVMPSPNASPNNDLSGVAAVGPGDVWAVGGYVSTTPVRLKTLVEHWNGSAWSIVSSPNQGTSDNHLAAVSALADHQWAVGYRFTTAGPVAPLVLERCM